MYTNLVTSALGLSRRRARGAPGGRPRPRPGQHPGRRARALRPDRGHARPSTRKVEACRLVKELGWPLTLNVVLHRQNIDRIGARPRAGRGARGRPGRAGQHAVLRLGVAQPRRAAAQPGAARAGRGGRERRARAAARTAWTSSTCCPTTTAATPSPAWAGGRSGSSRWRRTATSCPARPPRRCPCPRASVRDRLPGLDLGGVAALPALPGHRTGCPSRAAAATGRRSTSGDAAARRSSSPGTRRHRPGLPPVPRPRPRRRRRCAAANEGPATLTLVPRPHRVGEP